MNTAYKQILKATTLFGSVQGLNILISLVRTKLVAVILGPAGVGLNSIYNETRELMHTTTNLGLDVSGIRGVSQAYDTWQDAEDKGTAWNAVDNQIKLLRSWVVLLAILGMFVCMLLSTPLSLFTFGDYDHTWGYVILSPAVAFSTMTCGELAVLKALRRLKMLAQVSVINVALTLIVSIPIYYFYGINGVLPALLGVTFCSMVLTMAYSYKVHHVSLSFSRQRLKAGNLMLGIGIVFVISEGIGHLATLGIQAYLNNVASLNLVGLYNAGVTMTVTYAGMVFAAMETDYFPRLSGVIHDKEAMANTVMRQLEVNIILVVPMLILFIVMMPFLVPLLLDSKFNEIIPMTQVIAIGLLFRAITLPNRYLPLAAGDSKVFFFENLIGAIDTIVVIPGYMYGGLYGVGIALTVQNLLDMLVAQAVTRYYYNIRCTSKMLWGTIGGTALLLITYFIVM